MTAPHIVPCALLTILVRAMQSTIIVETGVSSYDRLRLPLSSRGENHGKLPAVGWLCRNHIEHRRPFLPRICSALRFVLLPAKSLERVQPPLHCNARAHPAVPPSLRPGKGGTCCAISSEGIICICACARLGARDGVRRVNELGYEMGRRAHMHSAAALTALHSYI